uniref:SHSP domain-containing protein n=1 Tax=Ascaris lumbricoides TaxID=6252 RepID=A0A0M3HZ26_ASCLU
MTGEGITSDRPPSEYRDDRRMNIEVGRRTSIEVRPVNFESDRLTDIEVAVKQKSR